MLTTRSHASIGRRISFDTRCLSVLDVERILRESVSLSFRARPRREKNKPPAPSRVSPKSANVKDHSTSPASGPAGERIVCKFYLQGICGKSEECEYLHPQPCFNRQTANPVSSVTSVGLRMRWLSELEVAPASAGAVRP